MMPMSEAGVRRRSIMLLVAGVIATLLAYLAALGPHGMRVLGLRAAFAVARSNWVWTYLRDTNLHDRLCTWVARQSPEGFAMIHNAGHLDLQCYPDAYWIKSGASKADIRILAEVEDDDGWVNPRYIWKDLHGAWHHMPRPNGLDTFRLAIRTGELRWDCSVGRYRYSGHPNVMHEPAPAAISRLQPPLSEE